LASGEAYHSSEAKDIKTDRESLFAIDGVTDRDDCDASYDLHNANKLNLIPVFWFWLRETECSLYDYHIIMIKVITLQVI